MKYPETDLVHRPIMQLVEMHIERFPVLQGLIHVPNEGDRTKAQHGRLIGLGMRPGVSDLLFLRRRHGYNGLAMELKAPGNLRKATPQQKSFLCQQQDEGWLACVCDDPAVGWSLLNWYMRGDRVLPGPAWHNPNGHLLWAAQL